VNLPEFWRWEAGEVDTKTYNLAESRVLPPLLDQPPPAQPLDPAAAARRIRSWPAATTRPRG